MKASHAQPPSVSCFGLRLSLKAVSLVMLTAQNVLSVLFMRIARTNEGPAFLAGSVIIASEVLKMVLCVLLLLKDMAPGDAFKTVQSEVFTNFSGTLQMSVPALCYTFQNFMVFIAITRLDVTTYQATFQLKLITTGLFSVLILGRRLSPMKWLSLAILAGGLALVQLSFVAKPAAVTDTAAAAQGEDSAAATPALFDTDEAAVNTWIVGVGAIVAACLSSGFAGVYFEKMVKRTPSSLWIRNIQLALWSLLAAGLGMAVDADAMAVVRDTGFFTGYDAYTYTVISMNAAGGLIVAMVVKYADSILKGFSTSVAIVIGAVLNVWLFSARLSPLLLAGIALVIGAVSMYSRPESAKPGAAPGQKADAGAALRRSSSAPGLFRGGHRDMVMVLPK